MAVIIAALTAENTFSDPLQIPMMTDNQKKTGFNLSISGTFSAVVTVQRSFDGATWRDVETFTAPTESIGDEIESLAQYRAGVKTGDFTSGTVNIRLGVN